MISLPISTRRMPKIATRRCACGIALLAILMAPGLTGQALAGGSAENVLLIIDPASKDSLYVGNYYRAARDIPPSNVIYMSPISTFYNDFREIQLQGLFGALENGRFEDHIDYIVLAPGYYAVEAPGLVKDSCYTVNLFSSSSCYTMAFISQELVDATGSTLSSKTNQFFQPGGDPNLTRAFDSSFTYLGGLPSASVNARRYFIGASLGYTGDLGNTPAELIAMIDRSVAADGTRPPGTFYFMDNVSDPARNVRAPQFSGVISSFGLLGGSAIKIVGALPDDMTNCLGVLTGAATIDIPGSGLALLPGAFGDHLTSFAGAFWIDSQTKMSEWIRNGASGTWGTVEEPCNYTGKFPHTRLHMFYYQGLSLGEAAFRSLGFTPFQGLLYGDPLTRAFAHIPLVTLPGAPSGPISGVIALTPSASTSHPTAAISNVYLHVDGRHLETRGVGQPFLLDTTRLSDGWHDLRFQAQEATLIASIGRWAGGLIVNNLGRSASLSASTGTGTWTTPFMFTASAAGAGATEIRVVQNNRVLAAAPGSTAAFTIYGATLGAGPVRVQAEALFGDGSRVRSAPLNVNVAYTGGAPTGQPPVAFSYTHRVLDHSPFLVDLPATYSNANETLVYTILSGPAQAVVPGSQSGPWRLMKPNPGASGSDTFTFRVSSASGSSNVATVTLVYDDCPDLTGDWVVGQADLGLLLGAYGSCTGAPQYSKAADLMQDGCIGQADLGILLSSYGKTCP
jgi:hypothetical protein